MRVTFLLLLLVLIAGCSQTQADAPVDEPAAAPIYLDLRDGILSLVPAEIGLAPQVGGPRVWGVLMEMVIDDTPVSLVSVADGSTSLYFGNGGGIIGAGETAAVAAATDQFITTAERLLPEMSRTDAFPLPVAGRVIFYVLTHDGAYTADVVEPDLQAGGHVLSPLYTMGQDVITQVRLHQQSGQ